MHDIAKLRHGVSSCVRLDGRVTDDNVLWSRAGKDIDGWAGKEPKQEAAQTDR